MAWQIKGKVGPMPYSFGVPTVAYLKARLWNSQAPVFTPHLFGIGWAVNFNRLLRLLKILK